MKNEQTMKAALLWSIKLIFNLYGLSILIVLLIPAQCFPITIMKNVGHGDCYVVISDGRVVLVDMGPASSINGLVSLLKQDYSSFDRIVITHVHSDHVGGLVTAEEYVKQEGSAMSADKLVSNRGEHDLNLVIRDSNVKAFLAQLRNERPVVGLNDEALDALKLNDENIEVKGYRLQKTGTSTGRNENQSGLILKVTEIRDGIKRATLFLGDIAQKQQAELFNHPNAKEIFQDVHAVTLPHHGRTTTLASNFFEEIKRLAGNDTVVLHSDRSALQSQVTNMASNAGVKIISTADKKNSKSDVYVNLFNEKTYFKVGKKPLDITEIVKKGKKGLIAEGDFNLAEVSEAVAKYSGRPVSTKQKPGTPISMPTDSWLRQEIAKQRNSLSQETDTLISQLNSSDKDEVKRAEKALAKRVYKLTDNQVEQIKGIMPGQVEQWEQECAGPAERRIKDGIKHNGWIVATNSNIDSKKLIIQTKWRDKDSPGVLKYLVTKGDNNTWSIYEPGKKNKKGIISYGKKLGTMRAPTNISIKDYEVCEYCGNKAIGHCHMRDKYVCDTHRYFTQNGTNWACP